MYLFMYVLHLRVCGYILAHSCACYMLFQKPPSHPAGRACYSFHLVASAYWFHPLDSRPTGVKSIGCRGRDSDSHQEAAGLENKACVCSVSRTVLCMYIVVCGWCSTYHPHGTLVLRCLPTSDSGTPAKKEGATVQIALALH